MAYGLKPAGGAVAIAAPVVVGDCCKVEVRIRGGLCPAGEGSSCELLLVVDIVAADGLRAALVIGC